MTEEVKPATDAMIESDRAVYGAVLGHTIARYIARIDAERAALSVMTQRFTDERAAHALAHKQWEGARAARIAAEARVEALEAALRAFIAAHEFAGAESWDCTGETRQRFEHAASVAKLLLEDTANG